MQLVSAKFYFVVLGYETGSQRVARLENMILGQLKIGDVKQLVEACLSRVECSNVTFVNLGHVPWKAWIKHFWGWLALLDTSVW